MELSGIDRDARVLLLGTGLPCVSVALALISRGHRGKIVALSEDGVLPPDLPGETAAQLHEIVAWHRLSLKAGRVLRRWSVRKGTGVRAIRVEYFSHDLGANAKLDCDVVLEPAS